MSKKLRNKGTSIIDFPNEFVVIDIETTGLSTEWDEIIEIGAIKIENNTSVNTFSQLIKPTAPIDSFITELTGITNEDLNSANDLATVLPEFQKFIGSSILVGHNINFDINFLYDSFERDFNYQIKNDYIDTLRLARKILPNLDHHRVDDLILHYKLTERNLHRALGDCKKTLSIYNNLKNDVLTKYSTVDEFKNTLKKNSQSYFNLSKISTTVEEFDESNPLYKKVCVFTGKLEKMTRREAAQIVADLGGINGNSITRKTNFLILGNNDYCKSIKGGKSSKHKKAEELILSGCDLNIIPENVFYDMINEI